MQMTSFEAFQAELQALCRQYEACLAVTQDGQIGLWDLTGNDRAVYDLVDCRLPVEADVARASGVPDSFIDSLSASLHAGFVCKESSRTAALQAARRLRDAKVVPIGSNAGRRDWAIISRGAAAISTRRTIEST